MAVNSTSVTLPPIVDRHPSLDAITVWLERPISETQIDLVRASCGFLEVHNEPMEFSLEFQQRLQLKQPRDLAFMLLRLMNKGEYLINYAEVALDLITASDADHDALRAVLDRCLVQPYHGKRKLSAYRDTSYSAYKRWTGNSITLYSDRESKVTGETNCNHVEWRISGARSVVSAKLATFEEVLKFDHQAFWRKKLRLYDVDLGKFGRAYLKTSRRTPWMEEWLRGRPFDMDRKIGQLVARGFQEMGSYGNPLKPIVCAQVLKDNCKFNIDRALVRIPEDALLPPRTPLPPPQRAKGRPNCITAYFIYDYVAHWGLYHLA
ncbi:MAG TPA: hypothetical protein VMX97_08525 [Hyphomicrobiaceae bacterium]|nr:hypothetical protein [Hyphomicrobiaceae bacterium]